ncbi:hypothetical protein GN244_ATG07173 [Phytophthora infestans]|uniref:Uncharacterized protein n=1 Tax=Phytophthora infestans TaxID=4787 RepID=A0A833TBM4_PHYIN|nr:hypothetical protein GN244_ATG07173 [Phytophthora infestans]KAF4136670.1 hypothetical protein GN958_ATG14160 [Phytophthora infestans]
MQLSSVTATAKTKQPLLIVEAWSGDDVALEMAQPERALMVAVKVVLRAATCRLWGWIYRRGVATTQICQEELLPIAQPAVFPLSIQHMDFIANSFEDIMTQQQLMHAVLEDLRRNPGCRCESNYLRQVAHEAAVYRSRHVVRRPDAIRNCIRSEQRTERIRLVHALRGGAGSVGAKPLSAKKSCFGRIRKSKCSSSQITFATSRRNRNS